MHSSTWIYLYVLPQKMNQNSNSIGLYLHSFPTNQSESQINNPKTVNLNNKPQIYVNYKRNPISRHANNANQAFQTIKPKITKKSITSNRNNKRKCAACTFWRSIAIEERWIRIGEYLLVQGVEKESWFRFELGANGLWGGTRRSIEACVRGRGVEPLRVLEARGCSSHGGHLSLFLSLLPSVCVCVSFSLSVFFSVSMRCAQSEERGEGGTKRIFFGLKFGNFIIVKMKDVLERWSWLFNVLWFYNKYFKWFW